MLRATTLVLGVALGAAATGCGSAGPEVDPKAAEPRSSPPLRAEPVGRVAKVGFKPEGAVFDARTGLLAVGLREERDGGAGELALVDRSLEVVKRVPISAAPRHLQLADEGGPVLVPAEGADALDLVQLPGGEKETLKVGKYPHDATAYEGRIYVGDELGDTMTVYTQDGRRVTQRPVARQSGSVNVAPARDAVSVVSVRDRVVELFDARTVERVASKPAGVGPTHVVSDGGGTLFVTDTQGDALLVYRIEPELKLTRRIHLEGGPYGIALDRERKRLYVAQGALNQVTELTAGPRPRTLRRYPTVRQPNTIAVDPATTTVYVLGKADGVVQAFTPGRGGSPPLGQG